MIAAFRWINSVANATNFPLTICHCLGFAARDPQEMDVDHEHILDSESILSMTYLPQSIAVLGSGVIAMEYATIFANLGVKVTVIDRSPLALSFLDEDCSRALLADFEARGGTYLGGAKADSVVWNGTDAVEISMPDNQVIRVEKCLFALGRVANIRGLHLDAAGVELTERKQVKLSDGFQTTVPHIYGVGDVIGPPSLGSASIDQGRRAIAQMLDLPVDRVEIIPYGIYTIPEMACCGISEQQAETALGAGNYRAAIASYAEIARGQISASQEGFIKLVADAEGEKILGVHVVGENASEIVHLGLMAMSSGWKVADFVDRTFNFPTLAEGYRLQLPWKSFTAPSSSNLVHLRPRSVLRTTQSHQQSEPRILPQVNNITMSTLARVARCRTTPCYSRIYFT